MTEDCHLVSSCGPALECQEEPSSTSQASEIQETEFTESCHSKEGAGGVTRAEPLSAKQQVALWLTRTSTQEIYSELTMSNLKSWVYPHTEARRHKQPLCGPSQQDMPRNFSTKSLLEGSHGHYYEDSVAKKNLIRKCETVLALSEESQGSRARVSKAKSRSKASLYTGSRISLFRRPASKCGSEIMTSQTGQHFPGIRPTNRLRYCHF